jgi:hypothetical protein
MVEADLPAFNPKWFQGKWAFFGYFAIVISAARRLQKKERDEDRDRRKKIAWLSIQS